MADIDRMPRAPLALIVAEHEWATRSLESVLAPNGYAVQRAYTGRTAFERARAMNPDLLFVDMRLPDMDAVHVCRALRTDPRFLVATPILAISSGVPDRQQRLALLKAGAWDVIGLPTDTEELLLRLDTWVRAKIESDETRETSLLDQITGLYSLRGLLRRARELTSEAVRHDRSLACIAIGAEQSGFLETTADTSSELAGRIAQVFRQISRESDAIGRFGESDFIILAPDTDAAGAERLARRVLDALAAAGLSQVATAEAGKNVRVRAGCYAVAGLPKTAYLEPAELLSRATMALRRSQAQRDGEDLFVSA
jgi:diguanylate cyclase (GGDEF)-like protein